MHIIFGKEQADHVGTKYTVLELDTFQIGENGPLITAYCTIETVPFEELPVLEQIKTQHEHLMINYKLKNWNDCLMGIDQLLGKWRGELDSFYTDLRARIQGLIISPPLPDWSPVVKK